MNFLFVIDCLGSGGAQRQMVNLAVGLNTFGHEIDFFVYYPQYRHFAGHLQDSGISVHKSQKHGQYDWRPVFHLRQLLRSREYDLALAFLATPAFYLELAALGTKVPIVVSERSVYVAQKSGVKLWLLQQPHRFADHITVNSHHQFRNMVQTFPWMEKNLSVIYNGVDLDIFYPPPMHTRIDGSNKAVRFLALGSVVPNKNPFAIAQAFVALMSLQPELLGRITLSWAGKITDDPISQGEFARTNALLQDFGLQESWYWLGERPDVPDLLRTVDALIHPAFYEGLPNAICEALASGLPVLASYIGDHPHLIEEGKTGFLFSPHEAQSIADAIIKFCSLSDIERMKMVQNARCFAETVLSMERFVSAYEDLFIRVTT
jgi:GalNAc-alpha-(1->4)-GalNAc-alpha-(1->3)-diNAcBac-PP-undecaprenol alpha-1,4-N-acetyl-D-galactosaminyltransferase